MMPLGRPGYPDDIAKALFLASDMASARTSGANLMVEGRRKPCGQRRKRSLPRVGRQ